MQSPVSSVAAIVPSLLVILSVPHMSSLQIDVENSNPDACTIANIIELFMGHQIETIKRSPQGIAVSLALFSASIGSRLCVTCGWPFATVRDF